MRKSAYDALHNGAALIDLTGRGHFRVTGEDRVRFLHAMCTNHVERLTPGEYTYAFLLTAQGKIVADVNILCTHDLLVLDTEPETRERVRDHLERYIIADDAVLDDMTGQVSVLALEGPRAPVVLQQLNVEPVPGPLQWISWERSMIAAISAIGATGYRLFVPRGEYEHIKSWVSWSEVAEAGPEEWDVVRLENARPRYGVDITESQIPHETQLLNAVHFNKGCYLGQEIVERVRSRGHVNRKLVQVLIEADQAPAAGTSLVSAEGKPVGEITSAAFSPRLGKVVALAYVRTEAVESKAPLRAGEAAAVISAVTPG